MFKCVKDLLGQMKSSNETIEKDSKAVERSA